MRGLALLGTVALAGCGGGERLKVETLPAAPSTIELTSPSMGDSGTIPRRFTCDGAGDEPAMRYARVPSSARELALIVADPDAPGGRYVHLTRYGLRAPASGTATGGEDGENSAGDRGWTPPCPPEDDPAHRYVWTLYALRAPSGLDAGAKPDDVVRALDGKVAARGTLTARFGR